LPAVVRVILDALPEQEEKEFFHLGDKVFLFLWIDLDVNCFSSVFGAKPLLFPGFNITTVTATSISFFYNNSVSFVVSILETFDALNTGFIGGTVKTLSDWMIEKLLLVSPLLIDFAQTDLCSGTWSFKLKCFRKTLLLIFLKF
jgi:hypothetical protein